MTEASPLFFDENQPALFGEDELGPLFSEEERGGKYTGERLESTRPDLYKIVCKLLGAGCSATWINQLTGLHHYTVQAVAVRETEFIEGEKERTASLMKYGRHALADKLAQFVSSHEINNWSDAQKAAIIDGILTEKAELLSGNATARIARTSEGLEDAKAHFDKLPGGSGPVLDAEWEITSFSGDAPRPKEDEPGDQALEDTGSA